jgi:hypothetical protein
LSVETLFNFATSSGGISQFLGLCSSLLSSPQLFDQTLNFSLALKDFSKAIETRKKNFHFSNISQYQCNQNNKKEK